MRRFLCLILAIFLMAPAVSAAERPKYAALTFDDGPSGRFTQELLEGLEARDMKATFFLCGYRLEDYGELAQQIRAQGHEIGIHGYDHASMARMGYSEAYAQIENTRALLPAPYLVNLLRTPGGNVNDQVLRAAEDQGLAIISWSVDTRDWESRDADRITSTILRQTGDGDIILMHDMYTSSVTAALESIDLLKEQGYEFLTVSQLALLRLNHLNSGQVYLSFPRKNREADASGG